MIKLAVFDFDSTLMDGETIDFLAQQYGVGEQVKKITEQAMQGELDFFESLTQRVALLKGLPEAQALDILHNLPYISGAQSCIQNLKSMGMTVLCFSGGFRPATTKAVSDLGLDGDFANQLHVEDGLLSGYVGGEMMFSESKGVLLQRMQKILSISPKETLAIGDGANDLSMFAYADTRIAFCAKPILQDAATHCIHKKDLNLISNIIQTL